MKKIIIFSLVLVAVVATGLTAIQAQVEGGNFVLEIVDERSQPLSIEYVVRPSGISSTFNFAGRTNAEGIARMTLPPGTYEVTVGAARTFRGIVIEEGKVTQRTIIFRSSAAQSVANSTQNQTQVRRSSAQLTINTLFSKTPMWVGIVILVLIIILVSIRQVNQWQRGVKFTFGKYSSTVNPGWRLVFPVIQNMQRVDMRLKTVDVPSQDAITKDNVSAKINAVIYYKVTDAAKAIVDVQNIDFAVLQLAQTSMRNIAGSVTLDELLAERQSIAEQIEKIVDQATTTWGVDVTAVELKDIELPETMVRTIGKQAEAERERRAVIINSEGEVVAAQNLAKAAEILSARPGALHLRTLNSINDISSDQSNTVIFTVPLEVLQAFTGYKKNHEQK